MEGNTPQQALSICDHASDVSTDDKSMSHDTIGQANDSTSEPVQGTILLARQSRAIAAIESLIRKRPHRVEPFVHLINEHKVQNDPKALLEIRRGVYESTRSIPMRSAWLVAEMQALMQSGLYDDLLLLFGRCFSITAIPAVAVVRITELLEERALSNDSSRADDPSTYPLQRIWPTSKHNALIWRWAISTAPAKKELQTLYAELCAMARVRIAEGANTGEPSPNVAQLLHNEYRQPPAAPIQIEAAHFEEVVATHRGVAI